MDKLQQALDVLTVELHAALLRYPGIPRYIVLAGLVFFVLRLVWAWGDGYRAPLKNKPFPPEVFKTDDNYYLAIQEQGRAFFKAQAAAGVAVAAPTPAAATPKRGRGRSPSRAPAPVTSGKVIECRNPSNGNLLSTAPAMGIEEVFEAVNRARAAQRSWAHSSFAKRREVLQGFLDYIVDHMHEMCKAAVEDSGKTMMEAGFGEILTVCEKLKWTIANGEAALLPEARAPGIMPHKSAYVEFRPLGVIGVICPWNYPLHHIFVPMATALMAGNAAVIKVSEMTTHSLTHCYGPAVHSVLQKCGISQDLVTFVTGYGDAGAALVRSGVDKIFFTGSPQNGKRVMQAAADTLTPVILELGGKDPLIVLEDADFVPTFNYIMRGVYMNSGQNCLGAERIYVMEGIYDRLADELVRAVRNLRQGDPTAPGNAYALDLAAMTMPNQCNIVEELVNDAVAKGAKLMVGGKPRKDATGGSFFEPTVLTEVTHDMRIVKEEAFGPVMLLMRVKSDEEVVSLANDTKYGLSCYVFSRNTTRAHRIGAAIRTGMLAINDFGLNYLMQALPFGGAKISGFGKFNGVEGLREAAQQVSVISDRFGMRTSIPPPLRYPIAPHAYSLVEAGVQLLYGRGIFFRLGALGRLLKLIVVGGAPRE